MEEQAVELEFDTILTSGQQATAPQGAELLAALEAKAAGRVHIMAGSGVKSGNLQLLHDQTGITHFHLSAKRTEPGPMRWRNGQVPMGLPIASEYDRQYCDPEEVRRARAVLDQMN